MKIVDAIRRDERRNIMWTHLVDATDEHFDTVVGGSLVVTLGRGAPTVYLHRAIGRELPPSAERPRSIARLRNGAAG